MKKYETMFIVNADMEEAARKELVEGTLNILKTNGANVTSVDEWGNREFAYDINFQKRGYYVVANFECDNALAISEFERLSNINKNIIRFMIIAL